MESPLKLSIHLNFRPAGQRQRAAHANPGETRRRRRREGEQDRLQGRQDGGGVHARRQLALPLPGALHEIHGGRPGRGQVGNSIEIYNL